MTLLLAAFWCQPSVLSFTLPHNTPTTLHSTSIITRRHISSTSRMIVSMSKGDAFSIPDANDKSICVGNTVRVAVANLKAHQVPPKAYGTFDTESGEFLFSKTQKYLTIPVGLMGLVTKVYDNLHVSANYQIQVKFKPSEGEKYNVPVPFLMHFDPNEVEVVE